MINYDIKPPRWPKRYLFPLLKEDYLEDIEGDLEERFYDHWEAHNLQKARRLYIKDAFKLLTPALIKKLGGDIRLNHLGMFLHNLKIGKRNLLRHKTFTLINVGGLVMGLVITLLISLWILDETSFDMENDHYDKVAQVYQHQTLNGEIYTEEAMPFPLPKVLEEEYGEYFKHVVPATWFGEYPIYKDGSSISAKGAFTFAPMATWSCDSL